MSGNNAKRYPGDLRSWIEAVDAKGALRRVAGASANLEIGRITEINNAMPLPKALLFEDIPDIDGRVLVSSASSAITLAETLGLDANTTEDIVAQLRGGRLKQWFQQAADDHFEWVLDGPVAEFVKTGKQIDITVLPAPLWREFDGGRYIGTGCVVVTQDPESGAYNGGTYRTMVVDRDHVTILFGAESRHGRRHQLKWLERGQKCPVVISLGHDPIFGVLGGIEVPEGVFEIDVAGAVLGRRARMMKGRITGLPIPADAELVIEGWLGEERAPEGPFGEFLGYYASGGEPAPLVEIEAIYHRNNPIVLGSPPGKPPHDLSYYFSTMRSALLHDQIQAAGVPDVCAVWADEVGGGRLLITVAIKQRYFGHSRQAGLIAAQCQAGVYLGRYVIVVDHDVNPMNIREVMWALVTRSDPASDILTFDKSLGSLADPLRQSYEPDTVYSSRAVIDACRPFKDLAKFPIVAATPRESLEEVRRKWSAIWEG